MPHPTPRNQERRRQGGSLTAVVALALIGLLALAAVALDGGYMKAARGRLQHVADSSALAGVTAIRDGSSRAEASALAQRIAEDARDEAGCAPVKLDGNDIEFGTLDPSSDAFRPEAEDAAVNAVRVVARRQTHAAAGTLALFFGSVTGRPPADIAATSVAAIRLRDVVIVQDRDYAGVASFAKRVDADLAVAEEVSRAIQTGVDIFERDEHHESAEKLMLVLTDDSRCRGARSRDAVRAERNAASAAADLASSRDINVYVIALASDSGEAACPTPEVAYRQSLARGYGYEVSTSDPGALDDILVSIVRQKPVRLVQ